MQSRRVTRNLFPKPCGFSDRFVELRSVKMTMGWMVSWTDTLCPKRMEKTRHTPARRARREQTSVGARLRGFVALCLIVVVVSVAYPGEQRAILFDSSIGRSIRFARSDVVVGASTVRSRGSRGGDARRDDDDDGGGGACRGRVDPWVRKR